MHCPGCQHLLRRVGTGARSYRVCADCGRAWFDASEVPKRVAGSFVAASRAEPLACPRCGARELALGSAGVLGLHRCGSCGGAWVPVDDQRLQRLSVLGSLLELPFTFPYWVVSLLPAGLTFPFWPRHPWPPKIGWEANLDMKRDFEDAVRRGDGAAVAAALRAGADVNARDGHGESALMIAAHRGDLPLVELLLEHCADPDVTAKYNLSALMLAVVGGHARVARALARAGADLRVRGSGAPGFAGKTALDLARERGMAELEDVLAER